MFRTTVEVKSCDAALVNTAGNMAGSFVFDVEFLLVVVCSETFYCC